MTILGSALPSASADIVAVFLSAGNIPNVNLPDIFNELNLVQAFPDARPMSVQVSEPVSYPLHPIEDGNVITDNSVVQPIELSISFILRAENYRETYLLMRQAKKLRLQFTVQTKTDNYTRMYISNMPHEETPDMFDTISIVLQFRQLITFTTDIQELPFSDVINQVDASTVARGSQVPTPSSPEQEQQGSALLGALGDLLL